MNQNHERILPGFFSALAGADSTAAATGAPAAGAAEIAEIRSSIF